MVMPITSAKNFRLSSGFGVSNSMWPRWARSKIGSGFIGVSPSREPDDTGSRRHTQTMPVARAPPDDGKHIVPTHRPSSPAHGDPVRRGFSDQSRAPVEY